MKPKTKVIIIIATICMALGLACTATSFALAGFDVKNLSTSAPSVEKSYFAKSHDFTEVHFEGLSENVFVKSTSEENFSVKYHENDYLSFKITEDKDTLHIVELYKPKVMVFSFNLEFDRATTINVPESFTGTLNITSANGIVHVENFSNLENITASSINGGLEIANLIDIDSVKLESASDRINVATISANRISASNMSGDITLENLKVAEELNVETISGAINFSDIVTAHAYFSTGSEIIGGSSISCDSIVTNSTSGDIMIDLVEAAQITANNTSGSISYSIIGKNGDYYFTTSSMSGNINVPQGANGAPKTADLSTVSGDIYFGFIA